MTSIRDIYTFVNKIDGSGVQGYHVDNKYVDPLKIKQERQLSKSKDKATRPNVPHKTSFLDLIQKRQKKMPGPCTYEPKDLSPKSKIDGIVNVAPRKTIFDEMEHQTKKKNIPAAGTYDKVQVERDRTRMKSDIDRAERANFCDGSMRYSIENPGVGEYNSYHDQDKRAAKWVEDKTKPKASKSLKLPPVGTYEPLPVSYRLFDNERHAKKQQKSYFSRSQRWKKEKDRTVPFYNICSEWGMKNKHVKKDILSRLSSPSNNRSVYR